MKKVAKKIIIGNWKMNPLTLKEAQKLYSGVSKSISKIKNTDVVVCAPYIYLASLKNLSKKISLGAQDAYAGDIGAFTGEISSEMLYGVGVRYVILGHSEGRAMGETNADVNKKLKSALACSLTPIICVGETVRDDSHGYFNIVKTQVLECLTGINKNVFKDIIIAYEPVWALSTTVNRKDATSGDAYEMAIYIRKVLSDISNVDIANKIRIVYGGSVNERDAGEFLQNGGVDGLLAGRASLTVDKFVQIINIAEKI